MEETFKQEVIERINSIEIPEDLKNIHIGYIPLHKGVVIKKVIGGERKTASGLIIPEMASTNACMGRIVAVGPECSPYIRVGLLVNYNPMTDMETIIKGETYILNAEHSIEGIIEDKEVVIVPKAKTSTEIRKAKKIAEQSDTLKRVAKHNANEDDMLQDKRKNRNKTQFAVTNTKKR